MAPFDFVARRQTSAHNYGWRADGAPARSRRMLRFAALGLVCAQAMGCSGGARATRATGPDGTEDWWRITCRNDQQECIDEAAELCPKGYEVAKNKGRYDVGPGFPYYSGVMLVRCKDGR